MSKFEQSTPCQAVGSESIRVIRDFLSGAPEEFIEMLASDLLEPKDKRPVRRDGQLWERHQCQRCGWAILRLAEDRDQVMAEMTDPGRGPCTSEHGKKIIEIYQAPPDAEVA